MIKKFHHKISISFLFMVALLPILAHSQQQTSNFKHQTSNTDSIRIAANTGYQKAGSFKQLMLGHHYRKDWAAPVTVEVLDLEHFAGGLQAAKVGGGLQTLSLRLMGADGKEYVLRSVNKNPSKALDPTMRKTIAEDIVQDQISSSNPYSPLVVARLADAAGIYHTEPKLVYVPASPRLGSFEKQFAGTLCLLEERPSGDESDNPAFGYSKRIVNSQTMLARVFENSEHRVDERSFLKARLFDMLIGDWDRHEDQWLWASFKSNGKTYYKPIPRDRDQAFANLDGVLPHIMTRKWALRNIQHYDAKIKDVAGLNTAGMALDRNFTTALTLSDWIDAAKELQRDISDDAIATAFRQMPDTIYQLSGKRIAAQLAQRRDDLSQYAVAYYQFLSKIITITGTSGNEYFEVKRIGNNATSVTVYSMKNDRLEEKLFKRIFFRGETQEIRLYGLDGKDTFRVEGEVHDGILLRLIGGNGEDLYADHSDVRKPGSQTQVYDKGLNSYEKGPDTRLYISNDSLKNNYNRKWFHYDWLAPMLAPGYNVDDGYFVGGGITFKKQQFGKTPYGYMQTIAANYSLNSGAYAIWYKGVFKEVFGKADLHLAAKYNSPAYARNYYGMGNETLVDKEAAKDYYHVRLSEFGVAASLHWQLGEKHTLSFGNAYRSYKVENTENRFVSSGESQLDSAGFGRKNYAQTSLGYTFSTIDHPLYPRKGIRWESNAAYVQQVGESRDHFLKLSSELSAYQSLGRFTLASRSGFATNTGNDYQFYQANYLGGTDNLRGYHKQRFAGKTSVYQNSELRFQVGNFNAYLAKGTWGLLAFTDHGRVWIPGENSGIWHHGYGGGVWFLPFNKMAFTATYGVSKEDQLINIGAGFLF